MLLIAGALVLLDIFLGTKLYRQKKFWWFQLGVMALTVAFDQWAQGRVWIIDSEFVSGITIFGTHIETVLFGFCLLYLNTVLFEYFNTNSNNT